MNFKTTRRGWILMVNTIKTNSYSYRVCCWVGFSVGRHEEMTCIVMFCMTVYWIYIYIYIYISECVCVCVCVSGRVCVCLFFCLLHRTQWLVAMWRHYDIVVPRRGNFILFYFISFYTFHTCCWHCKERLGTSPSRTNRKARSPVTHIATANSWNCRKLLLGENRKCWL